MSPHGEHLAPDRGVLVRGASVYALVVAFAAVAALALVVSDGGSDEYVVWLVPVVVVAIGVVVLGSELLGWWWRAGRTAYVVADGRLVVRRGERVMVDVACANIHGLWVRGGCGWLTLLNPVAAVADGRFPHAVIWTDRSIAAPPILRAGWASVGNLESRLTEACRAHGMRSR